MLFRIRKYRREHAIQDASQPGYAPCINERECVARMERRAIR
jgi:hypothetical protein